MNKSSSVQYQNCCYSSASLGFRGDGPSGGVYNEYCVGISGRRHTVKPVLSSHSKIDKTNIFMTIGSLKRSCEAS